MSQRRGTATSNFGVGGRENHDASAFYRRFRPPDLSPDDTVLAPVPVVEPFVHGDARRMDAVADGSVALVVTSPPYFAGKQYEEELAQEGVPSSYFEYLDLLRDVFAESARKLEPGGRMAVNVANLGRKPYRSLAADVIRILEDLGLLLRGELIWQKGEGATGSCAWGSYRSAANPVLRDITERVIVASKGRFDRARTVKERAAQGLPHRNTLMTDDFLSLTLDVWSIPSESARRVGHPAPFPVELPEQLIRLYTYAEDLVLDPFMGSGSALVAAERLGRRYIGYDLDASYVELARARVAAARSGPGPEAAPDGNGADAGELAAPMYDGVRPAAPPAGEGAGAGELAAPSYDEVRLAALPAGEAESFEVQARREGKAAQKLAAGVLADSGFEVTHTDHTVPRSGVVVSFAAQDAAGDLWYFDVAGTFTSHRSGLLRAEVVWRALGRAAAVRNRRPDVPLVLLTAALPRRPGKGDVALRAAGPGCVFDAVDLFSAEARDRLARYAKGLHRDAPLPGFWARRDLTPPRPRSAR